MKLCVPELIEKELQLRAVAAKNGIHYVVTCTARALEEQQALYAQGRNPLPVVNRLRTNVKLPPLLEKDNDHCVTWTLDSKHITSKARPLSEAFDIAILDKNCRATYDIKVDVAGDKVPDYLQLARLGAIVGLTPGAFWHNCSPDYPHYQV